MGIFQEPIVAPSRLSYLQRVKVAVNGGRQVVLEARHDRMDVIERLAQLHVPVFTSQSFFVECEAGSSCHEAVLASGVLLLQENEVFLYELARQCQWNLFVYPLFDHVPLTS